MRINYIEVFVCLFVLGTFHYLACEFLYMYMYLITRTYEISQAEPYQMAYHTSLVLGGIFDILQTDNWYSQWDRF